MIYEETTREAAERSVTDETETISEHDEIPIVRILGVDVLVQNARSLSGILTELRRAVADFAEEQRAIGRREAERGTTNRDWKIVP